MRKIDQNLRKNEENGTLAHPGLWGWLRPWLQIGEINSNFENFESTLYMKSVSMPLTESFIMDP